MKLQHGMMAVSLMMLAILLTPACAAEWIIDSAGSEIRFSGTHVGRAFTGIFESWSARINFDPADPVSTQVEVHVATASAKTGTLIYDGTLPQAEWLDSKNQPDAVFRSNQVNASGSNRFELVGQLTIKGQTSTQRLPFTFERNGDQAKVTGGIILERAGLDIGQKSDPKAEWVGNDIRLDIKLQAHLAH